MMSREETLRRLIAFLALDQRDRPISLKQLARASGENRSDLYKFAAGHRRLLDLTARRLGTVFKMIEEGRLYTVEEGSRRKISLVIGDPQPPRRLRRILSMTEGGPRLLLEEVNPNAFPETPPLFRNKIR